MCLAVPMKVVEVDGKKGIAQSGGVKRRIGLELLKDVKVGEYVIVHAGFAIEKVDKKKAKETLAMIREVRDAGLS